MQAKGKPITVIDAEGLILGRMASVIAKRLLKGEEIVMVNAEKAVLSGRKRNRVPEAKEFLEVGSKLEQGPFHYRRPDRIVRKTVRGMLPYKQPKGKQAYKRLKVYMGVPSEFGEQKTETLEAAQARKLTCAHFTLGEFAKELGWNAEE
jgi:large subunit ribosomal protein L13